MDTALWATVVVALAGYAASFLTVRYTSAQAFRQLLAQKSLERETEHAKIRAEECRRFLAAARLVRRGDVVGLEAPEMVELRRAVAGLELYAPDLLPEPLTSAVGALEHLVHLRGGSSWSAPVTEAEEQCDRSTGLLVEKMRDSLDIRVGEPAVRALG